MYDMHTCDRQGAMINNVVKKWTTQEG